MQKQKFQNTLVANKYLPRTSACAIVELISISYLVHNRESPGVLKDRMKVVLLSLRPGLLDDYLIIFFGLCRTCFSVIKP
jgi:hypothetical protein